MKNKKGMAGIMLLFVIFLVLLVLGFVAALGIGMAHWMTGIISPVASSLGVVDGYNVSEAGRLTFGTLDTLTGMLPMIVGFCYLMLLVGCVILCLSYRGTQNPLFIGLYFAFTIVLVLVAILASNAFQDLYNGTDEIAIELQGMTMLSFLILQSPYIFGIVAFICGIFLFSGRQNENYGQGGYG